MYQIHNNVDRDAGETPEGLYWAWGEEKYVLIPTFSETLKKICGFSKIQLLFKTNFNGKFSHKLNIIAMITTEF